MTLHFVCARECDESRPTEYNSDRDTGRFWPMSCFSRINILLQLCCNHLPLPTTVVKNRFVIFLFTPHLACTSELPAIELDTSPCQPSTRDGRQLTTSRLLNLPPRMSTRDGHDSPIHINPRALHASSTMSTPISTYDYGTPSGASSSGARNDLVDEENVTEDDHLLKPTQGDQISDEDEGTDWTDGTDETVDSDGESIDTVSTGCAKAEAAQAVW